MSKRDQLNTLTGVTSVIGATNSDLTTINTVLPENTLVFVTSDESLRVSDGVNPVNQLRDHKHIDSYSPLGHTHLFGSNISWLMVEPKLWLKKDLENHPELVPLTGGYISPEKSEYLSLFFDGDCLLTNPTKKLTSQGTVNDELTLQASEFMAGNDAGSVFNPPVDLTNIGDVYDQWMTTNPDLNTEQWLEVTFKNQYAYRPTKYSLTGAVGDISNVFKQMPTPRDWTFSGYDAAADTWDVLDTRVDIDASAWANITVNTVTLSTLKCYNKFKLSITKWNAGSDPTSTTGLRRFYIYGRRDGDFAVPDIPSPNKEFVWVIPYKDLNVGLKHEDIGDIGFTGSMEELIPAYRCLANGSKLNVADEPKLYSVIGHKFDNYVNIDSATTSNGTLTTAGVWTPAMTDPVAVWMELILNPLSMPSSFEIDMDGYRKPTMVLLEGYTEGAWNTIASFDLSAGYPDNNIFKLDTNLEDVDYDKVRINFLTWEDGELPFGLHSIRVCGHTCGTFNVPNIRTTDGTIPYIVKNLRVTDVSPMIIADLQQNIADLSTVVSELANTVNGSVPSEPVE